MAKFCDDQKKHTDDPRWFDPLGPNKAGAHAPTGAPEMRSGIFDQIGGLQPQIGQDSATSAEAFRTAANDPGWDVARGNAVANMRGSYLGGGPELNRTLDNYERDQGMTTPQYLKTVSGQYNQPIPGGVDDVVSSIRRRGSAEAADTDANIRSGYSRAGLGFGTGSQQASQANRAATSARSDELEAGVRGEERKLQAANHLSERGMQNQAIMDQQGAKRDAGTFATSARVNNYGQERGRQTAGAEQLAGAKNPALNYLSNVSGQFLNPISQIAQMVQGLAGNGQIATPNTQIYTEKGWGNDVLSGIGSLAGGAAGGL